MKKTFNVLVFSLTLVLVGSLFVGCGSKSQMIDANKQYPQLIDSLYVGSRTGFDKDSSSFEEVDKGKKKILNINLVYDNQMLTVGIVSHIRNCIENAFKDKYDEINLNILQKNPKDVYDCKYINGAWDKEVE